MLSPPPGSPPLVRKRSRFLQGVTSVLASASTTQLDGHSRRSSTASSQHRQSPNSKPARRDSSISSLSELRNSIRRRSTSLRSSRAKSPAFDNLALTPDSRNASTTSLRPALNPTPSQDDSAAGLHPLRGGPFGGPLKKDDLRRPPATSHGIIGRTDSFGTSSGAATPSLGISTSSVTFVQIQETVGKRINTLEYLRKTHETRVYWFNTLAFERSDLVKLPYFDDAKLVRRAVNYLLLGLSLPIVLEPNSRNPIEYLRAFNSLMSEFESYQSIHPPDGSTASSFSKVRMPQMFRRGTTSAAPRRRTSGGDALSPPIEGIDMSLGGLAGTDNELLPGESYSYLLTPSIPFDVDYFETFSTLSDVLIDCYTKITSFVNSDHSDTNAAVIADLFHKVDSKVRKILVAGVTKDFEDACRQGIKTELAGVGKMVFGGLM